MSTLKTAYNTAVGLLILTTAFCANATQGTVVKIDKSAQKITIKHQEIKNLDMPPMTMAFRASPALLEAAAVGSTIEFSAEKVNGAYTVITMTPL